MLSLTILLEEGLSVFDGLLPSDVQSLLKHLTLCMVYSIGDGHLFHHDPAEIMPAAHMEWNTLFDTLLRTLQPLRLTHLRIVVHCDVLLDAKSPIPGPFSDAVRHPNLDMVADTLYRALPSLEFVVLTASLDVAEHNWRWKLESWFVTRGWRRTTADAAGADGVAAQRELRREAVDEIIKSEDLWFSKLHYMDSLL
ncbi:hypothetical protein K466DRAFT_662519 [Polyporus arcularius HHB13444]|uniref:Uncharacterized protein n=1 Tax=Polyporus arcularius HHB13444 TaxID=1314778 RepID=A0A5C3PFR8_9APHY|nr:hypothetical protein K466DRAFT_662519 [Polyporus arcularius HHB13444]